ncbi:MAG: IS21-like element helper ATPase IstB [Candidatus Desulforudaceae bacterium]
MTNETTIEKLREMHRTAFAESFRDQLMDPSVSSLSFEERLGLLVDVEWASRKNNRLRRLIKSADFDQSQACIADIDYRPSRKLNKAEIQRLATCNYIMEKHNIIIMGATGTGKSYMACAFGIAACQKFKTVKYIRLPDLLVELAIARNEGSYKKVMSQYRKLQLLILDEWVLVSLKESEARDLLEIIHARHHRSSTIFCSQFAPAGWHAKIGEATIADAILDRIVHDSYMIEIHSDASDPSMREMYGINKKQ